MNYLVLLIIGAVGIYIGRKIAIARINKKEEESKVYESKVVEEESDK